MKNLLLLLLSTGILCACAQKHVTNQSLTSFTSTPSAIPPVVLAN